MLQTAFPSRVTGISTRSGLRRRTLDRIFCIALLLPIAAACLAQDNAEAKQATPWYQIEVLIFANDDPYAAGPERWPEEVELSYPQRIVALSTLAAAPTEPAASTQLASSPQVPATEEPFVALDRSQLQLSELAARILRQRDFRLLFHQAWRQPTTNREESVSLLVRGGDSFDDHRELEGWIQLSVERYLHFRTDLWLSSFKSTAGLDALPWPKLPKLPVLSLDQAMNPASAEPNPDDLLAGSLSDLAGAVQMPAFSLTGRQYVVDQTVVLRQSRRMRSDELHYIDHPLMGILVKVTPFEIPSDTDEAADDTENDTAISGAGSEG